MFVKSSMSVPVTYNKSTGSIVLNPKTVTYVDESIVTAEELISCYGDRISVIPQEIVEEIVGEAPKADEQDLEINNTPDEGKGEDKGDETESNTGDEAVDNFLNGKTDNVPEGTEEITEEEALKLKAQADAEAKAKEEAEKLEALKAKEAAEKAKAKEEAKKTTAKASNKTQNKPKAGKNK